MPTATKGSTVSDGLIAHQQQMLDAIQRNTSGTITKAFSEMIAAVMPSAARFRSAYQKELQRVQDEAEDDSEMPHVSLYWLVSSGMLKELVDAINDNMEKAAKETAPAIQQGQQQAAQAGQVSATAMSAQAAGVAVSKVQQPTTQPAQPDEGTDETIDGLPSDTSGNAKKAIMAGVLAGLGGQALMQGVQTVLTGALQSMLGLGESSAAQAMQQGASLLISANSGLLDGWIWTAEGGACIACLEMDGSFHTWDEDMDSHPNCGCMQVPYSGPQSGLDQYAGQGEDWFNAQDDAVQAEILGPSKYLAWKNGDLQLMDLVSKEGGMIHERSLRDLGLDFRDYLQQLPTKRELLQLPDISLLGPHPMDAVLTDEEKALLEEAQLAYAAEVPKLPEINVPEPEPAVSPEVKALQDQRATLATQRDAVQSKLDTLSEKWRAAVLDQAKYDPEDDAEEWAAAEKKIQAIEKQQATQMKKLDTLNGKMAKVDAKITKELARREKARAALDIEAQTVQPRFLPGKNYGVVSTERQEFLLSLEQDPRDVYATYGENAPLLLKQFSNQRLRDMAEILQAPERIPTGPKQKIIEYIMQHVQLDNVAEAAATEGEGAATALTYTLPEIDQEAEDKLVQQIQDVLGTDTGVASHPDVMALGQPIQDYLDERMGPLADYVREAYQIIQPGAELTDAQKAWYLQGDTSQHGGLTVKEVVSQYQAAMREETARLLGQVRDVGGEIDLADGADETVAAALKEIQQYLPTDWIEASNDQSLLTLETQTGKIRGFYQPARDGSGTIALATEGKSAAEIETAMAHEIGHRMQDSTNGIWLLEKEFYNARTAGEDLVELDKAFEVVGKTRVDAWALEYIGKEPILVQRSAQMVDAAGQKLRTIYNYELLSTGLEWLYGKNFYGQYLLNKDPEFLRWLLGVLFGAKDHVV